MIFFDVLFAIGLLCLGPVALVIVRDALKANASAAKPADKSCVEATAPLPQTLTATDFVPIQYAASAHKPRPWPAVPAIAQAAAAQDKLSA